MIICGFRGAEPQINADERRYIPVTEFIEASSGMSISVTDFGAAHRKGRKERCHKLS